MAEVTVGNLDVAKNFISSINYPHATFARGHQAEVIEISKKYGEVS